LLQPGQQCANTVCCLFAQQNVQHFAACRWVPYWQGSLQLLHGSTAAGGKFCLLCCKTSRRGMLQQLLEPGAADQPLQRAGCISCLQLSTPVARHLKAQLLALLFLVALVILLVLSVVYWCWCWCTSCAISDRKRNRWNKNARFA
jgi:hypothetical protein